MFGMDWLFATFIFNVFRFQIFKEKKQNDKQWIVLSFAISENIITKQNPEYERLDLSKVEDSSSRENKDKGANIDFRKENREIRSAVGTWKEEEAEKQYRQEQKSLSRNELRNLDSRGR